MKQAKTTFGILSSFFVIAVLISAFVIAEPKAREEGTSRGGSIVMIPSHAIEVAEGVFSLGAAVDDSGNVVEGYAVFHHRNGHDGGPNNGNDGGDSGSTCYSYLSNGAKWNTVEPWVLNPTNSEGLDSNFLLTNMEGNIVKWENEAGVNIMGTGSLTNEVLEADTDSPDNVNEVYFADVDNPGAIAVTIVWGVFRGPPSQRGLISWDMVFDDVDFDWSNTGDLTKMDFENIAAHEVGHAVGMGHAPQTAECLPETMFPTASNGETSKRDLHDGDKAGVSALY